MAVRSAFVTAPVPWTADLSRAGVIGMPLLLFFCGPQGAQACGQRLSLQMIERKDETEKIYISETDILCL